MRKLKKVDRACLDLGRELRARRVDRGCEAGPYQTTPYPGASWRLTGEPKRRPHEYVRRGTAKLLTLFHPATGEVRVRGVRRATNEVLHPWLEEELTAILETWPPPKEMLGAEHNRSEWKSWQEGLSVKITLPLKLPPLRMLLVWDNLVGHLNGELFYCGCSQGGSWRYTRRLGAELVEHDRIHPSIQRILVGRALAGEHPRYPEQIIEWLEDAARGWNRDPTPFEWGALRALRRVRSRKRRHALGGSGACTRRMIRRRRSSIIEKWRHASQATH
jgi:hypothetical protein